MRWCRRSIQHAGRGAAGPCRDIPSAQQYHTFRRRHSAFNMLPPGFRVRDLRRACGRAPTLSLPRLHEHVRRDSFPESVKAAERNPITWRPPFVPPVSAFRGYLSRPQCGCAQDQSGRWRAPTPQVLVDGRGRCGYSTAHFCGTSHRSSKAREVPHGRDRAHCTPHMDQSPGICASELSMSGDGTAARR